MAIQEVVAVIDGMHCEDCRETVLRAIDAVAGVKHVTVSLAPDEAAIRYDAPATLAAIEQAVNGAGPHGAGEHGPYSVLRFIRAQHS